MTPCGPRPDRLVVVLGTATEVGKTWVTAEVARRLGDRGVAVVARKPAQSYEPGDRTDAEVLAAATGEDPEVVTPPHRWYPVALAPPMAADVLGRQPFTLADLEGELAWPARCEVGFVETVGGPRSPVASDGDGIALLELLQPDAVVLVAHAGLGTLNAVRLCDDAVRSVGYEAVVLLNRFDADDDLHRRNLAWLDGVGIDVLDDPAALASRLAIPAR